MKILIAPLNWGLGHASRCLPLIVRHLKAGDEVVLAGDGDSLALLRKHFPALRFYTLPSLHLRYSAGNSQIGAILCALPRIALAAVRDHRALREILKKEAFDLVISDNRFGLFASNTRCAYITHQLMIAMPNGVHWLEPMAYRLHQQLIQHYTECWIPDTAEAPGLSGALAHRFPLPKNARYIGPLSRFEYVATDEDEEEWDVVAVLSGLEPQRTMLEKAIIEEYLRSDQRVLIVRGQVSAPPMAIHKQNITLRPYMPDSRLAAALLSARTVISRSGYSSIMDYAALGLLEKQQRGEVCLRLVATPGQPEQEYLAQLHNQHL